MRGSEVLTSEENCS